MARKQPKMPPPDELQAIVMEAIAHFKGQSPELESAIGFLYLGHAFGWRVVHLFHSPATVRKYEAILGIKAMEVFPESTVYSDRSKAYSIVKGLSNFWKAVKGQMDDKDTRSREIGVTPF